MEIVTLTLGDLDTNCYLVHGERGTVVIDPAAQAQCILDAAQQHGWTIDAVVLTHAHFDHMGAADALPTGEVYLHPSDEPLYRDAQRNLSAQFGAPLSGAKRCIHLRDGDDFYGFTVLHTPGHTPGGISLYHAQQGVLFCGDTLFCGGYGRTDFPGGSPMQLMQSLRTLLALPEDTAAYPGHGAATTIKAERSSLGWRE